MEDHSIPTVHRQINTEDVLFRQGVLFLLHLIVSKFCIPPPHLYLFNIDRKYIICYTVLIKQVQYCQCADILR